MSQQKAVSEFFQPRKRQRPGLVKEGRIKSSVLPEGQDDPVRKVKRLKKDHAGMAAGTSSSVADSGVKFHQNKEQLLLALGAGRGKSASDKSDAKQAQINQLKDKLASFSNASQKLQDFEATNQKPSVKNSTCNISKGTSSKNDYAQSSGGRSFVQTFVTPARVQRNLFGDDDDEKAGPSRKEGPSNVTVQRKTPPGMSPQKMKETLMNCNKIGQLKERLAGFNSASQKLKNFEAANKKASVKDQIASAKPTLEFEITSPVKTPRKTLASPSPKKTPAYQRFQHLLHDAPSTLAMPYKYRFLKEAFHCLDTVASFLHNRKEIITFKRLKTSVQEMLNKNFTEVQLAQIKTVFPFAYIFRREKNLPNHKVTPNNKNKWQLTLEANTNYEADMKAGPAADGVPGPSARGDYRKLSPAMLLERGRIFHASLLDILLQHHHEFLQLLDPPVAVDPTRITRWHPEFSLESVPDVPAAALPMPPLDETGGTARDVLERARSLFSQYPHLQETLEAVAGPGSGPAVEAGPTPAGPQPGPSAGPALTQAPASRLPSGLLERIRAREAASQQRLMTRTPAESRRLGMLGRLPQLARSVRATFVTERRAALPLQTLVARLADSSRSLAECDDLGKHVDLLTVEAPDFVQMVELKSGTFVKMCKDADVNAVVKSLEKKLGKQ